MLVAARQEPRPPSWLCHRAVAVAEVAPGVVKGGIFFDGEFGGEFFVHIDTEARFVVGPVVAVFERGTAGEGVLLGLGELAGFLNAEVGRGEVEVDVGGVADGGDVAGAVPGGPDAEEIAHGGHFASRGEAADL